MPKLNSFLMALSLGACTAPTFAQDLGLPTPDDIKIISQLSLVKVYPLNPREIFHPQGMYILGSTVYLSSVEGKSRDLHAKGHLYTFQLGSDQISDFKDLPITLPKGQGHLGGLDYDQKTHQLIAPLAVYDKYTSATLLSIDPSTLAYQAIGTVNDHIGTVVMDSGTRMLRLFNWDAAAFFSVNRDTLDGADIKAMPARSDNDGVQYQDCKSLGSDYALCSGQRPSDYYSKFKDGFISLIHFNSDSTFTVEHRLAVEKVNQRGEKSFLGKPLTQNPMFAQRYQKASGQVVTRFYFVPHDGSDAAVLVYDSN